MTWLIIILAVIVLVPLYLYVWYRNSGIHKRVFASPILMLHNVSDRFDFSISNVRYAQFIKFIEEAKDKKWDFGSLDEYFKGREGTKEKKNLYLTFDDGYVEIFDVFQKYLEPNSIPATIFLTTGFLGKRADWDYKFNPPAHMSLDQVKELAQSPLITFGSHTVSHADLARLSMEKLKRELVDSRKFLEDNLQKPVEYLSVPFGRFSMQVLNEARKEGYRAVFCGIPYKILENDNISLVPRIPLNLFDNLFTFTQKIQPGLFSWMEFSKSRVIELFSGLTDQARGRH